MLWEKKIARCTTRQHPPRHATWLNEAERPLRQIHGLATNEAGQYRLACGQLDTIRLSANTIKDAISDGGTAS
jgi:hypothetical protein